ncbi:WD40 repeat-like protein [Auricularia subglabra TFB-10046 SS5]|nr:WD40 repeat-like protein [Auricularia subglabra TFB-10046 SS5]
MFSYFISLDVSELHRLSEILQPNSKDTECGPSHSPSVHDLTQSPGIVPQILGHKGLVCAIAFLSDTNVVSASYDGTICIWDVHTGESVSPPTMCHSQPINCLAVCGNGNIASGADDGTCIVWDSKSGQALCHSGRFASSVTAIAYSADGKTVAVGTVSGAVYLLELTSDSTPSMSQTILPDTDLRGNVLSLTFSPDSHSLAVGCSNSYVVLWDLQARTPYLLQKHYDWVRCVAFSPDGKFLASGSDDSRIVIWRVDTREVSSVIDADNGWVMSVAYSPDGRHIVSCSLDNVHLWVVATGEAVGRPMRGHRDLVHSVAISPDGCRIASGGADHTVHIWDRIPFWKSSSVPE